MTDEERDVRLLVVPTQRDADALRKVWMDAYPGVPAPPITVDPHCPPDAWYVMRSEDALCPFDEWKPRWAERWTL